jgi:pimeloyl-ACP methyl ester carboxylesterase
MSRIAFSTIAAVVLLMSLCIGALGDITQDIKGSWLGTLALPGGMNLRLALNIESNQDGSLTGILVSIDQGGAKIPVDTIDVHDGAVAITVKAVGGSFQGTISVDGKKMDGQWRQNGNLLPLTFERSDNAMSIEVKRPQTPKKPYPYKEEQITYTGAKSGIKFAGTLTLPDADHPVPAVLMVTGSGPHDRDETIFGHKPFLVIADYLTRRGIAVLRVDDRGVGGTTGDKATSTTQDFAGDVLAGVEYLKTRSEINRNRIGLIGHSEGGLIAPLAASRSKDVAFVVMMAGPGVTGEEILYKQGALILKAAGASDSALAVEREAQHRMFEVLKTEKDPVAAEKKLREIVRSEMESSGQSVTDAAVTAAVKPVLSPWFGFFLTYDPRPTLMKVKVPVLAINGELDLQVPPTQNLPEITKALKASGNKDFTIKELPQLNHLFQTAKTGSLSEYSTIEETISPVALKVMGDWIVSHTTGQTK